MSLMNIIKQIKSKKQLPPLKTPHWHHDFLDYRPLCIQGIDTKRVKRVYTQPYKGIFIIFWKPPTPDDIKMAQDDFDSKYPDCEDCSKNLFVCTCMVELEGFTV